MFLSHTYLQDTTVAIAAAVPASAAASIVARTSASLASIPVPLASTTTAPVNPHPATRITSPMAIAT